LRDLAHELERVQVDRPSEPFAWAQDAIEAYLRDEHSSLGRALGLETTPNPVGAPIRWDNKVRLVREIVRLKDDERKSWPETMDALAADSRNPTDERRIQRLREEWGARADDMLTTGEYAALAPILEAAFAEAIAELREETEEHFRPVRRDDNPR